MTQAFAFPSRDGVSCRGDLALPPGEARAGALIVVHEWWGLNEDMRRITDRFAAEGFLTLAVDLYGGRATQDRQEAMRLATEMKTLDALEVVAGATAALRAHPRCNGKVGVTGFCLGGAIALAAACRLASLDAAVPFYGIPKDEYVDWSKLRVPVLAHFGEKDASIPKERPVAIAERATDSGASFELFLYPAGHAFMRESDPAAFDAESAKLAWERTVAFLKRTLG